MNLHYIPDELWHFGVEGMEWGKRRYQNEDGTLTELGKIHYGKSLTSMWNQNDDGDDFTMPKGTSVFRRIDSGKDDNYDDGKPYTYTYDYDNDRDDDFYKQFGKKVMEYSITDDAKMAGKRSLGKAFVDKMLTLTDENDIDAMDMLYSSEKDKLGHDYVEGLFTLPYEPSKHTDALEKAGASMVSHMLTMQRHEKNDAKMRKRGFRDYDTAANDIGRSIIGGLLDKGYSGMRDYNDHDSVANVTTPTIVFDRKKMDRISSWLDDQY